MADLFEQAGIYPPDDGIDNTQGEREGGRERSTTHPRYGGHNLRATIPAKVRDATARDYEASVVYRPRSNFTPSTARRVLDPPLADPPQRNRSLTNVDEGDAMGSELGEHDEYEEGEYSELEEDDDAAEDDDIISVLSPQKQQSQPTHPSLAMPTQTVPTPPPSPPPRVTIPLTNVREGSQLSNMASNAFGMTGFNLKRELGWQVAVAGDTSKIKSFRQEVTQQVDVTPFGFMRPASPYIQILHSVATYAVRGGASDLHNMDFGFTGDRTDLRIPHPVIVDDKMWKWIQKKLVPDVTLLEGFYANPANARLLYHDDSGGGDISRVPLLIYLPPPFLVYCIEEQRTPFELHQFATRYATRDGSEVTIQECELLMDWCFMAAHRGAAGTPTTSMLAITVQAAPTDDDDFLRWLYKVDCTRTTTRAATPSTTFAQAPVAQGRMTLPPPPMATAPPPVPPSGAPPPDIWTQMANNIASSFTLAAAAMKPPQGDPESTYENGGVNYDKFQMATIKGFAHTHTITRVPIIWAMFQHTKNLETHKDNLRRKMAEWAYRNRTTASGEPPIQVQIERSLYIPDSTMKEILSLKFNPGGIMAEAEEADMGMSLLICRARSTSARAAIKKHERALANSKRNRSMAEAKAEEEHTSAYDTGSLPDTYHDLMTCVGTYCAMLHALFGEQCSLFQQCFDLWTAMNDDLVYEQRNDFGPLFCRQITWAVLMESRVFFSKRLSVEDIENVHPTKIKYPQCKLHTIIPNVTNITPILRASFPTSWYPTGVTPTASARSTASAGGMHSVAPPVQAVATTGRAASVVSGITTGTTRNPRPPATIRTSDINPQVKATMEAYIAKNKGVYLTAILNHVNLTMEDLPTLPRDIVGNEGLCYNYILGRCNMDQCQHKHVQAGDVPDEFVTELLNLLRPGIVEFTTNGVPPGTRRRRRPRRRRDT